MKEIVARELARRVKDGDVIGIGSGSTVELALAQIGERVRREKIRVTGVPTSHKVALLAAECGIEVLHGVSRADLAWCFDGADEVDGALNMIKGQGAAMLNEKIIAERSKKVVIIVSEEKLVSKLGEKSPVPVEFIPEALGIVEQGIKALGASKCFLRTTGDKGRFVITEHNNLIFDVQFPELTPDLGKRIKSLTGVVEHGLFFDFADEVLVAKSDGVWSMTHGPKGISSTQVK